MPQPIIGLEIHVQAKTKSKMFSPVSAEYFGDEPNTHVDPVAMGLPGALPVPNREAIAKCIALSLALNCQINQKTKFDRKNYFYPDLPKGYQISQCDFPVGHDGFLEIDVEGDSRRIRIRRVHIEEDTGKSIHTDSGTLLDYNKAGVPLIEIVTEPDFAEVKEVIAFAKLLKQTVQYVGVSDAEMQKGQMRFELNISLRTNEPQGKLPNYKVEVKNIGSISVLEKVIQFEIKRQAELLASGKKIVSETRGIRDMTGATVSQRLKETENDYRYFPEPDIPLIHLSNEWISEITSQLPELPAARRDRYVHNWGLELEQAEILVEQRQKGDWIDGFVLNMTESKVPASQVKIDDKDKQRLRSAVKWFVGDISGMLEKSSGGKLEDSLLVNSLQVKYRDLLYLVDSLAAQKISGTIVKQVLEVLFTSGGSAEEIIKANGWEQISDSGAISEVVKEVIANNAKLVESLEKNPNAINALVGQVMKATKGQANPKAAEAEIKKQLNK